MFLGLLGAGCVFFVIVLIMYLQKKGIEDAEKGDKTGLHLLYALIGLLILLALIFGSD